MMMMLFQVPVNYLAVLLSGVAAMVIGYFWYGSLFGKVWMKGMGISTAQSKKGMKDAPTTYTLMFVASLIEAYVLAHFIWYAAPGNGTLLISIKTAVWAWFGFIAVVLFSKYLFAAERKLTLLYIDAGFFLVSLLAMGTIFGLLGQ